MDNEELIIERNVASVTEVRRTGLERLDQIVRILDDLFRIPIINKRVGLDPIIGLIPWAGDAIATLLGMYIIGSAVFYRLPKMVVLRMGCNVIFDAVVGMLPFVGDVSDFFIKSNRWNLNLLREYADTHRQPDWSDYLFVGFVLSLVAAVIAVFIILVGASVFAGWQFIRNVGLF